MINLLIYLLSINERYFEYTICYSNYYSNKKRDKE
jgi:hypothetical protein